MVVEAPGETAAGNRERRGYGAGVGIHSRGAGDIMRGKARFIFDWQEYHGRSSIQGLVITEEVTGSGGHGEESGDLVGCIVSLRGL